MSPAVEILELRKQAGVFSMFSRFGRGNSADLTNYGLIERRGLGKPAPIPIGVAVPARMAPPPVPAHVQAAKNKSLATTQQIHDIMSRVTGGSAPQAAAPTPDELHRRYTTTVDTLKAFEASRARPKLPTPPGPESKAACFECPALDILSLRAA